MSEKSDKGISAQRLKSFIERIERLEEERKAMGADVREVYAEAKSGGWDVKIMRKVIALRKLDDAERQEQEALIALYVDAIGGDYAKTDMGRKAVAAETVKVAEKVRGKRTKPIDGDVVADADGVVIEPAPVQATANADELFDKAVALVARERKVSTSFIQRHLQLGYNSAARIVEEMQSRGMVSAPDNVGKREVLIVLAAETAVIAPTTPPEEPEDAEPDAAPPGDGWDAPDNSPLETAAHADDSVQEQAGAGEQSGSPATASPQAKMTAAEAARIANPVNPPKKDDGFDGEAHAEESSYQRVRRLTEEAKSGAEQPDIPAFMRREPAATVTA